MPGVDLLTDEERRGDADELVSHLLHAEPGFSVKALVWRPGQLTPIHDHVAWCAFGVLAGRRVRDALPRRRRPPHRDRPGRQPGRRRQRLRTTRRHPPRAQHRRRHRHLAARVRRRPERRRDRRPPRVRPASALGRGAEHLDVDGAPVRARRRPPRQPAEPRRDAALRRPATNCASCAMPRRQLDDLGWCAEPGVDSADRDLDLPVAGRSHHRRERRGVLDQRLELALELLVPRRRDEAESRPRLRRWRPSPGARVRARTSR